MAASARTDRWFSVLLTAFAFAVVVESWRMPRLGELGVHPMSAPGLTPGLLGLVLLFLGIALLVRSVRSATPSGGDTPSATAGSTWRRSVLTIALCLGYSLGLLGHLPFMMATGLFVFSFVAIFSFESSRPVRTLAGALAMAVAVAVTVSLLFEHVFLVRLP